MPRNPVAVVLLTLVTLGVYGFYWFYQSSAAVIQAAGSDAHPVLWTIGLFIPVLNAVIVWRYLNTVNAVTGGRSPVLLFLLWLVFFPAMQYLVQQDLNTAAGDAQNPVPP
ncbi:MAG: DUF4234 domain-containing protein [Candidatus Nanohaloarchaea archaeon]|nr:DUF4234 domain-containing protein [Candidatus Nanohaloarchaea archaeon]